MNHYQYLDKHWVPFIKELGIDPEKRMCGTGMISAHGDKCYGYATKWMSAGIPFEHGVMLYLLSYLRPWSEEAERVSVSDWVV